MAGTAQAPAEFRQPGEAVRQGSSWRKPLGPGLRSLPQKTKFRVTLLVVLIFCGLLVPGHSLFAQTPVASSQVNVSDLDRQVRTFLQTEVTAHVADIKTLDPPPERVVGAAPQDRV